VSGPLNDIENPSVPPTWLWTDLASIASTTSGGTPRRDRPEYYGGTIPWLKSGELRDRGVNEAEECITEAGLQFSSAKVFPAGTLCIALYGATVGKLGILGLDAATNQAVCGISPYAGIDTQYLFRFLEFIRRRLIEQGKGGAQPNISQGIVRDLQIPVAPTREQSRIVSEIEKQFTRLDAAVAALRRVQANLKRYRASVLKAACEGRLVPSEAELAHKDGRTYETGEQLLSRILKERRSKWEAHQSSKMVSSGKTPTNDDWQKKYKEPGPPDTTALPNLPEGWTWASVRQVGEVQLGRQRAPKYHHGEFMRPYLRVANVFEDRIDVSDVLRMTFTPSEFQTYELRHGDILLNEGQSLELIGRPAMYRDEVPGACFQNTLVRFRAAQGVEARYALIVFLSYLHNNRFQKIAKWTTNIAHLGAERFAGLEFPLPPVAEQVRIADDVEDKVSLLRMMEANTRSNSKRAQRLRLSILKRAFEGKLVPQDPTDEAAAVLLERIRSEQSTTVQRNGQKPKQRRAKVTVMEVS
jgi:type I restriction enzyme, S subunit